MRDEHDGLADRVLEPQELVLQPHPGDGVDRPEGLVHEQHGRVGGQGAGDAHPLALATGQLGRVPVPVRRRVETDQLHELVDASLDPVTAPAEQPGDGTDVAGDRLVREQADLLDHVADSAPQTDRVDAGHVLVVEVDAAAGRLDEPVHHLQGRGLPAAGRPDQHADLPFGHLEAQIGDRDGAVGKALGDGVEADHGPDPRSVR